MTPCPRVKSKGVVDGELRANGAYAIAPPSLHPNGSTVYRWIVEPRLDLPLVSIEELDLVHLSDSLVFDDGLLHSQHSKPSKHSKRSQQKQANSIVVESVFDANVFAKAIEHTIPTRTGERNRLLFELARRIKAQADGKLEITDLVAVFDKWWIRAEPIVATKDYAISLDDFLRAFANVTTAFGETMQTHLRNSMSEGYPSWVPASCNDKCNNLLPFVANCSG